MSTPNSEIEEVQDTGMVKVILQCGQFRAELQEPGDEPIKQYIKIFAPTEKLTTMDMHTHDFNMSNHKYWLFRYSGNSTDGLFYIFEKEGKL